MNLTREFLEDHAEKCETQLQRQRAFVKELKDMAARHGTDESLIQEDLAEAEHNIIFYESELKRLHEEMGGGGGYAEQPRPGYDSILPRTPRQGVGALVLASIGLLAGVIIGSQLASRRGGGAGDR